MESLYDDILKLAQNYPSGDNCQPWKISYNHGSFRFGYQSDRGQHPLNVFEAGSIIAMGAYHFYLEQSALNFGYRAEIFFSMEQVNQGLFDFSVQFSKTSDQPKYNIKALRERCTDRRLFKKLDAMDWQNLKNICEHFDESVGIKQISQPNEEFYQLITSQEAKIWTWKQAYQTILQWTRFSQKEIEDFHCGLNSKNFGLNPLEHLSLKWMRDYNWYQNLVMGIGFPRIYKMKLRQILANSGQFILLTTKGARTFSDLIEVGRVLADIWVNLNRQGVGLQPLTASNFLLWPYVALNKRDYLPDQMLSLVDPILSCFVSQAGINENEKPVFLLRTGQAPIQKLIHRSPRRPIELTCDSQRLSGWVSQPRYFEC